MEEKTIYVTEMTWGMWDDKGGEVIYVGTDFELAKSKALEFSFPDPCNNYGYVNHWENGKKTREQLVRE